MIDKIFYSSCGYIDSWFNWLGKLIKKKKKNERY